MDTVSHFISPEEFAAALGGPDAPLDTLLRAFDLQEPALPALARIASKGAPA